MNQSSTNTDEILKQLGGMLRNHSKQTIITSRRSFSGKAPSQNDIQKMLDESLRIIDNQSSKNQIKFTTKGKIKAASELLKEQKSVLIKNYIKQKIQSEVFANKNPFQEQQNEKFQKRKQQLIDKRQKQIKQQSQRRHNLIKSVKQFDSNSKARIPIHQIDTILHQQQPGSSYLLHVTPTNNNNNSKLFSSRSNQVKNPNLYIDEIYSTQEYQKSSLGSRANINSPSKVSKGLALDKGKGDDAQYHEINEEDENQEKFGQIYPNTQTANIMELFKKKPHLATIFFKFLEKQVKINSLSGAFSMFPAIFKHQSDKKNKNDTQNKIHHWKGKPKRYSDSKKARPTFDKQTKLASITQKFKLKGLNLTQTNKIPSIQSQQIICQKRINKMIGQSKKYHPKKCILTPNQLIYFEQSQQQKDTKQIDLLLQQIKIQTSSKQQGSFFSSKQLNNQIVLVQGKIRLFKYEKNFLQGDQLYEQLLRLMANKAYLVTCKLNGGWNQSLYRFINEVQYNIFSLGNQFLQYAELYPNAQYRQLTLNIIFDLFNIRPNVQTLNLSRSRVIPQQLTQILTKCEIFSKLQKIDLSHTRITKQNLNSLCQLVNSNHGHSDFEITLQDCKIDDEILNSNVGLFTSFTSKVKYLDLSHNNIGAKTLILLKNVLQNITCNINHLVLNDCPLRELSRLGNLIGQSRKLQILEAKQCFLDFQTKSEEEIDDFFSFFKATQIKKFNLQGNGKLSNSFISIIEKNWRSQIVQKILISLKLTPIKSGEDENAEIYTCGLNFEVKR